MENITCYCEFQLSQHIHAALKTVTIYFFVKVIAQHSIFIIQITVTVPLLNNECYLFSVFLFRLFFSWSSGLIIPHLWHE